MYGDNSSNSTEDMYMDYNFKDMGFEMGENDGEYMIDASAVGMYFDVFEFVNDCNMYYMFGEG